MAILEFAAITDGMKFFAETCYILEGGSEIIIRDYKVFKKLEHVIDNNYECPSVNRVVGDSLGLIIKRRDTFLHQKHTSSTKLGTEKLIVLESNERVQGLNNEKQRITGVKSQRGRSIVNTTRDTNDEGFQRINIEISVSREYFKKAKDRNKELKKSFDEA